MRPSSSLQPSAAELEADRVIAALKSIRSSGSIALPATSSAGAGATTSYADAMLSLSRVGGGYEAMRSSFGSSVISPLSSAGLTSGAGAFPVSGRNIPLASSVAPAGFSTLGQPLSARPAGTLYDTSALLRGKTVEVAATAGLPSIDQLIDAATAAIAAADAGDPLMSAGTGPMNGVGGGSSAAIQARKVGAALLAKSGALHTGCALPMGENEKGGPNSATGLIPAEQVALLKALSSGDKEFTTLVLASGGLNDFPRPTAHSARTLLSYGEIPVYCVRKDRSLVKYSLTELVQATGGGNDGKQGPRPGLKSSGGVVGIGIDNQENVLPSEVVASNSKDSNMLGVAHESYCPSVPVGQWTIQHVCGWLDTVVGLPQYQHRMREGSVDGAMLLTLADSDLHHLLTITHPLHRRKIEMGIARLAARDAMERSVGAPSSGVAAAATMRASGGGFATQQLNQPPPSVISRLRAAFIQAGGNNPATVSIAPTTVLGALAAATGEPAISLEPRLRAWVASRAVGGATLGGMVTFAEFVDAYLQSSSAAVDVYAAAVKDSDAIFGLSAAAVGGMQLPSSFSSSAMHAASASFSVPPIHTITAAAMVDDHHHSSAAAAVVDSVDSAATRDPLLDHHHPGLTLVSPKGDEADKPAKQQELEALAKDPRYSSAVSTQHWLREQADKYTGGGSGSGATPSSSASGLHNGGAAASATLIGGNILAPTATLYRPPTAAGAAVASFGGRNSAPSSRRNSFSGASGGAATPTRGSASPSAAAAAAYGGFPGTQQHQQQHRVSFASTATTPTAAAAVANAGSAASAPAAGSAAAEGASAPHLQKPPKPVRVTAGSVAAAAAAASNPASASASAAGQSTPVRTFPASAASASSSSSSAVGAVSSSTLAQPQPAGMTTPVGQRSVLMPGSATTSSVQGTPRSLIGGSGGGTPAGTSRWGGAVGLATGITTGLTATAHGSRMELEVKVYDTTPLIESAGNLHPDTARLLHPQQVLRLFHVFADASAAPAGAATFNTLLGGGGNAGSSSSSNPAAAIAGGGVVVDMRPENLSLFFSKTSLFAHQVEAAMARLGYSQPSVSEDVKRLMMARGVTPAHLSNYYGPDPATSHPNVVAMTTQKNLFAPHSQDKHGLLTVSFADFADFVAGVAQWGGSAHSLASQAASQTAYTLAARAHVESLAASQAMQLNALRMSLGMPAIPPPAVAAAPPAAPGQGQGPGQSPQQHQQANPIPVVNARGQVVYISPLSPSQSNAHLALASTPAGLYPGHVFSAANGGAAGLAGMPMAALNASLPVMPAAGFGMASTAYGSAAVGTLAPAVRDGAVVPIAVNMVDGWLGSPGTDPWYTPAATSVGSFGSGGYATLGVNGSGHHGSMMAEVGGMNYDEYATMVLHKPSALVEMSEVVAEHHYQHQHHHPQHHQQQASHHEGIVPTMALPADTTAAGTPQLTAATSIVPPVSPPSPRVSSPSPANNVKAATEDAAFKLPPAAAAATVSGPAPVDGDKKPAAAATATTTAMVVPVQEPVQSTETAQLTETDPPLALGARVVVRQDSPLSGLGPGSWKAGVIFGFRRSKKRGGALVYVVDYLRSSSSAPPQGGLQQQQQDSSSLAANEQRIKHYGNAASGTAMLSEGEIDSEEKDVPCSRIRYFKAHASASASAPPSSSATASSVSAASALPLSSPAPVEAKYRIGQKVEAKFLAASGNTTPGGGFAFRPAVVIDVRPVYGSTAGAGSGDKEAFSSSSSSNGGTGSSASGRMVTGHLYDVRYDGPGGIRDRGLPESDLRLPSGGSSYDADNADFDERVASTSAAAGAASAINSASRVLAEQTTPIAAGDTVEVRTEGSESWRRGTCIRATVVRKNDGSKGVETVFDVVLDAGGKLTGLAREKLRLVPDGTEEAEALQAAANAKAQRLREAADAASAAAAAAAAAKKAAASADASASSSEKPSAAASSEAEASGTGPRGRDQHGKTVVKGDRVEAKYKGKGTRYYKGTVTAVSPGPAGSEEKEANFSILYDDGDKETGAVSANVILLGKSLSESAPAPAASEAVPASNKAEAALAPAAVSTASAASSTTVSVSADTFGPRGRDQSGKTVVKGDRVEAKYKGKGTRYYKGVITAVTPGPAGSEEKDATFSILYDDGDKETGALSANVILQGKSLADNAAAASSSAPSSSSAGVPPKQEAAAQPEAAAPASAGAPTAAASSSSASSAPAVVDSHGPRGRDQYGKVLVKGDKVEAKYKGKGTRYYKGVISQVFPGPAGNEEKEATFNILYDDGDKEVGALSANVVLLGKSLADAVDSVTSTAPASSASISTAASAEKPASAAAEKSVAPPASSSSTASVPSASVDSHHGPRGRDQHGKVVVKGDRVEAKYKGKGTRYYKGTVTTVTPGQSGSEEKEATFSILYDDGDKEAGALSANIVLLGKSLAEDAAPASASTSTSAASSQSAPAPAPSAIEAAKPADPAKLASAAPTAPVDTHGPRGRDQSGKTVVKGDRVEAKYKGKGTRYYKGTITTVMPGPAGKEEEDATFSILYDDGDKETGALSANIILLGASLAPSSAPAPSASTAPAPAPAPAAATSAAPTTSSSATTSAATDSHGPRGRDQHGKTVVKGDRVEAKYKGKGTRYYKGIVTAVVPGPAGSEEKEATFTILYDDGDKETGAVSSSIVLLSSSASASAESPVSTAKPTIQAQTAVSASVAAAGDTPKPSAAPSSTLNSTSSASVAVSTPTASASSASSPPLEASKAAANDSLGPRGRDQDGKPVVMGDRVEAKYKGKGTRYYKGTITTVTPGPAGNEEKDATFSILYDDGDKESGALAVNIRLLGPGKAESAAGSSAKATFAGADPKSSAFADTLNSTFGSTAGGNANALNNTLNSTAGSRMRVSFSDDHSLELERSKDEYPRYAPARRASALASVAESFSSKPGGVANVGGKGGDKDEEEEYEDSFEGSLSGSGSGSGSFASKDSKKSATMVSTSTMGTQHLADTFKPLSFGAKDKDKDIKESTISSSASGSTTGTQHLAETFKPLNFAANSASDSKGSSSSSSSSSGGGGGLVSGASVEALDPSTMRWKKGKVMRVAQDGGVSVSFEDGEFEFGLPQSRVRLL